MSLPVYQIDAFAAKAFTGNPAAVVLLTRADVARLGAGGDCSGGGHKNAKLTALMQAMGAENNLSETAFIIDQEAGGGGGGDGAGGDGEPAAKRARTEADAALAAAFSALDRASADVFATATLRNFYAK